MSVMNLRMGVMLVGALDVERRTQEPGAGTHPGVEKGMVMAVKKEVEP